jgi:hypothetical protein
MTHSSFPCFPVNFQLHPGRILPLSGKVYYAFPKMQKIGAKSGKSPLPAALPPDTVPPGSW